MSMLVQWCFVDWWWHELYWCMFTHRRMSVSRMWWWIVMHWRVFVHR